MDDTYVTVTKQESKQDYVRQNQKYQTTNFNGRTENCNHYFPEEQKDCMEVHIKISLLHFTVAKFGGLDREN